MKLNKAAYDALSPDERALVDVQLAKLKQAAEVNPLVRYHPHPKQAEFHRGTGKVKAYYGGNRSGKTTAGIVDDIIQAVDESVLPERLKPFKKFEAPFYCRIVAPDFTGTMEGVIFEKIREWCPPSQLKGGSWDSAYSKQLRTLHFANGSWFQFMTFEQDRDKFGGAALDRIHVDEECPEWLRKECRMRLIDRGGDEVFTLTPQQGLSWSFDAIWERRHEPGFSVVQSSIYENPHLSLVEIEAALDGLSEEEKQTRAYGKFSHWQGLVYSEFSESHVVDPIDFEWLKGKQVVVGIDPGIRWMAVVFCAFDNDNDMVVFDELLLTDCTVETTATAILSKVEQWAIKPLYVIDPAGRARSLLNAESAMSEFARFGIYCAPGQNAVEAGVFQVKRRLQADPPALLIARNCQRLIWEIGRYRQAETADGSFSVVKVDDHALDAMRYAAMTRPMLRGTMQRRMLSPPEGWTENQRPAFRRREPEVGPMGSMA